MCQAAGWRTRQVEGANRWAAARSVADGRSPLVGNVVVSNTKIRQAKALGQALAHRLGAIGAEIILREVEIVEVRTLWNALCDRCGGHGAHVVACIAVNTTQCNASHPHV